MKRSVHDEAQQEWLQKSIKHFAEMGDIHFYLITLFV
jgi:hypothetical protein